MIIKKVILIDNPAPFVGTRLSLRLTDPSSLTFGFKDGPLADGCEAVSVSWGDGTSESVATLAGLTHAYASVGEYTVEVSDDIRLFAVSSKIASSVYCTVYAPMVAAFFSNATRLTSLKEHAFMKCEKMTSADVGGAAIGSLGVRCFNGCANLVGEVRLPCVSEFVGSLPPFAGCDRLERIVFSEANRAAIEASAAYRADPKLGATNAEVVFEVASDFFGIISHK